MILLDEKNFVDVIEIEKKWEPDVYANKESRDYIDIEKAKSIIRLLLKNQKLNDFLIGGFMDKYVEYIYKSRNEIASIPIVNEEDGKGRKDHIIDFSDENFKKVISKIVIDDDHLTDDQIQEGCNAYKELKKRKKLHNMINYKFLKKYALFVYNNRYQIRKLVSKDLCDIKIDDEGNYILTDNDFIEKINSDGGHNSPFWICINISQVNKEKEDRTAKERIGDRFNRLITFPEKIINIVVDKEEEKILKKQIEEKRDDSLRVVKNERIQNDIVVKNLLPENERETALIAEEIARQLGFPVAQYYPAKYVGTKYTKEEAEKRQNFNGEDKNKDLIYMTDKIVLTPNFLEEGEELITGDRIAKYEMDISQVPNLIREFLKKDGVDAEKIEELISDYRIVMAYNCFINHRDCHNGNWGFIKNEKGEYRISHIFDLEGSLDENVNDIRAIYIGDVFSGSGQNIDESLLMNLLQDEKCKNKVRDFLRLDLSKVFNSVCISKGITISNRKKQRVTNVIGKEKEIIVNVLKEINRKDNIELGTNIDIEYENVDEENFEKKSVENFEER